MSPVAFHRRLAVRAAVAAVLLVSGGALVAAGLRDTLPLVPPATSGPAATPSRTPVPAPAYAAPAANASPFPAAVGPPAPALRPATPSTTRPETAPEPARTLASEPRHESQPLTLRVPAIGVSSSLVQLGLQQDRSLEVPNDFSLAGWFERGPSPGERGPAVIAGHVDSRSGPAVFYRLSELQPGHQILVDRADGSVAEFVVEQIEQHPKADFPTDAVYGWVDHAGLRLITCGGSFDRDTGHYRDNLVVFASLVAVTREAGLTRPVSPDPR